jgi:hypothetical protein
MVMPNSDSNGDPVAFTYAAATGRITYASGMGFNQYMVRPGFVFVDSAGAKHRIVAVDNTGNYVDVETRSRDVDTTTPTTTAQGAILMNFNPYDLPLTDLRSVCGAEFVPIDSVGVPDLSNDQLVCGTDVGLVLNDMTRRYSEPFDPRIKLRVTPLAREANEAEISDASANNRYYYGDMNIKVVELTAFCSGAMVVIGDAADSFTNVAYIDGAVTPTSGALTAEAGSLDNAYGMIPNRYQLCCGEHQYEEISRRAYTLPLGIHHFLWILPDTACVRGVYILQNPKTSLSLAGVSDVPGRLVQSGGVNDITTYSRDVSLPTNSEDWDKGGRIVRYIDSDLAYQYATQWIRGFTDTGDVSAGSASIQNVGNASQWRTGDYIMWVKTNVKYVHRIDSIAGTTITLRNIYPGGAPSQTGITLYYYGRSYHSDHNRSTEEIAFTASLLEFAAPGPIDDNKGMAFESGTARTDFIGVRLSDLSTGIKAVAGLDNANGGALKLDTAADDLIITFIGTGLSIRRYSSTTADVQVDNASHTPAASVTLVSNVATDTDDDPGGTYICGELPYGQHRVLIESAGNTNNIKDITVWQPKRPSFTGFALLDTNLLSIPESSLSITEVDGAERIQFGTVQIDAGSICHASTTNDLLTDFWTAYADSMHGREHDWGPNASAANDTFSFGFFGDEVTLVTNGIDVNAGTIAVKFLDHDGEFKVASSITGFTVSGTGPDTFTGDSAVVGERHRYIFSELAFHIMQIEPTAGYAAAQNIEFDCIEVHTPFHVHKTKQPVAVDHLMPMQFSGLDIRNKTPFKADWLPGSSVLHSQGATFHVGTDVLIEHQSPFHFYSRGGLMEVKASITTRDNAAARQLTAQIAIDGVVEGPRAGEYVGALDTDVNMVVTRQVVLAPGFHFAYVESAIATQELKEVAWSAKELAHPATDIPSRGLGSYKYGPAHYGESSF